MSSFYKRLASSMLLKRNITWQQTKRFSALVDGYITYKANTMFSVKRKKRFFFFASWELMSLYIGFQHFEQPLNSRECLIKYRPLRRQGISVQKTRNDLRNRLLKRAFRHCSRYKAVPHNLSSYSQ